MILHHLSHSNTCPFALFKLEFGDYDPFIPFDFGDDSDEQLQYLVRRHRHHPALSCWSNPNNRATILFSP